MLSVTLLLILAAFVTCIASAMGKCPLWISVVLVILILLIGALPLR